MSPKLSQYVYAIMETILRQPNGNDVFNGVIKSTNVNVT